MIYKEAIEVWKQGKKEDFLDKFFIKFTYCSLKIENEKIRFIDVENIFRGQGVIGFKGDKKTIKEIENHKKLCENITQIIKDNNTKMSIELIKQFHYILTKDCFTEEFIKSDYVTGISSVGSEVEDKLISLIEEINRVDITENNALKVVSYMLCCFNNILSFQNANGVVIRTLINYLLIGNNLPPIIFFYYDKDQYCLALEHFNEMQKIDKMVDFLEEQAYKTWVKGKSYNIKIKSLKDFLD